SADPAHTPVLGRVWRPRHDNIVLGGSPPGLCGTNDCARDKSTADYMCRELPAEIMRLTDDSDKSGGGICRISSHFDTRRSAPRTSSRSACCAAGSARPPSSAGN